MKIIMRDFVYTCYGEFFFFPVGKLLHVGTMSFPSGYVKLFKHILSFKWHMSKDTLNISGGFL